MTTDPVPLITGGLLFLLAAGCAAHTTRHLVERRSPAPGEQRCTVHALLLLLGTTALAVGGAAAWAGPELDLAGTWPFAIALLIALAPLTVASTHRRRHTQRTTLDGRPTS